MGEMIAGILFPFLGTTLGAGCVFLMKRSFSGRVRQLLAGLAAGIMLAASIWSLLVPAMTMADRQLLPITGGLAAGFGLMLLLEWLLPQEAAEHSGTGRMLLALTLHNIPEGIAVGVICAGVRTAESGISASAALTLIIGIAIQNFPEGAIVSLPLCSQGMKRGKAFFCGVLSGAVEPFAVIATILASAYILPLLPFFLSFAAGAMLSVIFQELVPEMCRDAGQKGMLCFTVGFLLMTVLDILLG